MPMKSKEHEIQFDKFNLQHPLNLQVLKQVINEFEKFFCRSVSHTIKELCKGTTILIMIYSFQEKNMPSINKMTLFLYL